MTCTAFLGLDLGGTGAKAGVYDIHGNQLGFGSAPFPDASAEGGRAEIPIESIHEAARASVRQAVAESGAHIIAMSISSQGQTFVALDGDNRPLHPAIMWYDSRANDQAEALRAAVSGCECVPEIEAISSAPKVMWLREHYPDTISRARRYLLLPEYFTCHLTGEAVNDPITALSSGLYVESRAAYCATALSASGIGEDQVARVQTPGTPIGSIRPEAAADWGLHNSVLLVTGTNDQFAGALGAGNSAPGIVSETTGSCLALVTLVERAPQIVPAGLLVGRYAVPSYQYMLAYSKTAGLVLDWFRSTFCTSKSLADMDALATAVPIGSRGVTVLPHFDGTFSPHPNPAARGLIYGLSLSSTMADMCRAILESLCFSLRENLEFVAKNGADVRVIRSIGGGAKSDLWLQMKADVARQAVERPAVTEAATLGAAILAATGVGEFSSVEECCRALYRTQRIFDPDPINSRLYEEPYHHYMELLRNVYRST